jgi:PIN domain
MLNSLRSLKPDKDPEMLRQHYVFIDYENVCESDLSRISGKTVRVFMILGTRHKKLPTSLFLFAQDHPEQLRIIQTPVDGRNALDFVLTLELGRRLAADPEGHFHIVSKDTGFDSVISHLKAEAKRIARYSSLIEIPALRTPEERVTRLKTELEDTTKPRPATRKSLVNKIQSAFDNNADTAFIEKTITSFIQLGIIGFTENDKVLYKAA